ncbi:MAG TPA: PilZ domain-containing protein [Caulifigura sp.]|nr:PilZ domain-containing protein [Caulifigura sp.]
MAVKVKPAPQAMLQPEVATGAGNSLKPSDRRREPRFSYQTVVTHVRAQQGATFELKKCWTRDLSPSGARIMSLDPIEGERLLLKFLLPKLGSKFVEAEICSRFTEQQTDICNRATTMYFYGVRFTKVLEDAAVCDRLL